VEIVVFKLLGFNFRASSAGPIFKINPSVSFFVNFDPSQRDDAKKAFNELWGKLAEGGAVFMPLDKYSFSERYGWIQDKYGLSWQIVPAKLDDLMGGTPEQRACVTQAFLQMKKSTLQSWNGPIAGVNDRRKMAICPCLGAESE
jgi:predicted 3-demethylubiquinone-9 3-methyltransferase (glyoxalase superfamily)